jgi:hypothetical protein
VRQIGVLMAFAGPVAQSDFKAFQGAGRSQSSVGRKVPISGLKFAGAPVMRIRSGRSQKN